MMRRPLVLGLCLVSLLSSCVSSSGTTNSNNTTSEDSSLSQDPLVTFKVAIPIDVAATSQIKIAGSFNSWSPLDPDYVLTELDQYDYEIEIAFDIADIGTQVEYKYVLLLEGQTDNGWTNVEGSSSGGEIANRSYTLIAGRQTVNDTVQTFKNNASQNSVTRGTLEKVTLAMPQYSDGRTRMIRIWLPDGYDQNATEKRYPVMYMHDGQNLFDSFTSFAGEWRIDETIGAMMDDGYPGAIVVGIDNSADRLNELSPDWTRSGGGSGYITNPSGEKYASFIVDTVKPYVDGHFNTETDRAHTGVGGSSMGGVISFYMALTYPDIFGYGLLFSTAMWIYASNVTSTFIQSKNVSSFVETPRFYIYAGGLETSVTPYVAIISDALIAEGYPSANINTHVDPNKNHNEYAWATYFPIAYPWLVGV